MPTAETLRALLALVEEAKAGSRELDFAIYWKIGEPAAYNSWNPPPAPLLTTSVDAARALTARLLPDFWMSSGLCSLTGHASIGPDYNGPAGERLRSEWPEADFHSGFHADLAPGDGPHRECYAILSCMLQALIAKEELAASAARSALAPEIKEANRGEG